ncbi:MAG TPA: Imm21 family immunity protein [Fimbriiglobus sp.]|nr:Imm21 family immunity protein [Fimbriiglobus sp.]
MSKLKLNWIEPLGGPLLLLPRRFLPHWTGGGPIALSDLFGNWWEKQKGRELTDYDRACAVGGYAGVIEVGTGSGLVLADEPNPTTWWKARGRAGGYLVRWVYADHDDDVHRALQEIPTRLKAEEVVTFRVDHPELVLFDSVYPGREAGTGLAKHSRSLSVHLARGYYRVKTSICQPDETTRLVLHQFTPHAKTRATT